MSLENKNIAAPAKRDFSFIDDHKHSLDGLLKPEQISRLERALPVLQDTLESSEENDRDGQPRTLAEHRDEVSNLSKAVRKLIKDLGRLSPPAESTLKKYIPSEEGSNWKLVLLKDLNKLELGLEKTENLIKNQMDRKRPPSRPPERLLKTVCDTLCVPIEFVQKYDNNNIFKIVRICAEAINLDIPDNLVNVLTRAQRRDGLVQFSKKNS